MTGAHEILGILPGATILEIKRAYRKKVKLYHPDISTLSDCQEKFVEITKAYEYLIRTVTRSETIPQSPDPSVAEQQERYEKMKAEERAKYYARMRYEEFKKTKYYKATMTAYSIYLYLSLGLGVSIIVGSIYGFMKDLHDPRAGMMKYMSDLIIFFVGVIFLVFSYMQMNEKRII